MVRNKHRTPIEVDRRKKAQKNVLIFALACLLPVGMFFPSPGFSELSGDSLILERTRAQLQDSSLEKVKDAIRAVGDGRILGAIPDLVKLLGDDEWHVRRLSAEALGKLLPDSEEALIPATSHDNVLVREWTARLFQTAYSTNRKIISGIERLAKDKEWKVRREGLAALANIGTKGGHPEKYLSLYIKAWKSDWRPDKQAALKGFATLGKKELAGVVPLVAEGLDHEYSSIIIGTLKVLGLAGPEASPFLDKIKGLGFSKIPNIRSAALETLSSLEKSFPDDVNQTKLALLKIGTPKQRTQIALQLLDDEILDGELKITVYRILLEDLNYRSRIYPLLMKEGRGAAPILIELLKEDDKKTVLAALYAFAYINQDGQDAVPTLVKMLEDSSDPEVRVHLVAAVGEAAVERAPAVGVLVKARTDSNEDVRKAALDRLNILLPGYVYRETKRNDPDLGKKRKKIPKYLADFKSSSPVRKKRGKEGLISLGEKAFSAIPVMIKIIEEDPDRSDWASEVLGSIGPEALRALQVLAKSRDGRIHSAAVEALARLAVWVPGAGESLFEALTYRAKPFGSWWHRVAGHITYMGPFGYHLLVTKLDSPVPEERISAMEVLRMNTHKSYYVTRVLADFYRTTEDEVLQKLAKKGLSSAGRYGEFAEAALAAGKELSPSKDSSRDYENTIMMQSNPKPRTSRTEESPEVILAYLGSSDSNLVRKALGQLYKYSQVAEDSVDILLSLMASEDSGIRRSAINALSRLKSKKEETFLPMARRLKHASDPDSILIMRSIKNMITPNSKEVFQYIERYLYSRSKELLKNALDILLRLEVRGPEIVRALESQLEFPDPRIQIKVVDALNYSGYDPKKLQEVLLPYIRSKEKYFLNDVLKSMAKLDIPHERAAIIYIDLYDSWDEGSYLDAAVLRVLAYGSSKCMRKIERLVKTTEHRAIRVAHVASVGPMALKLLMKWSKASDKRLAVGALNGLGMIPIRKSEGIARLKELLTHPNDQVKLSALRAAENWKKDAFGAMSELKVLSFHSNGQVEFQAHRAINVIKQAGEDKKANVRP